MSRTSFGLKSWAGLVLKFWRGSRRKNMKRRWSDAGVGVFYLNLISDTVLSRCCYLPPDYFLFRFLTHRWSTWRQGHEPGSFYRRGRPESAGSPGVSRRHLQEEKRQATRSVHESRMLDPLSGSEGEQRDYSPFKVHLTSQGRCSAESPSF